MKRAFVFTLIAAASSCSHVPGLAAEFDKSTNTVRMTPQEVEICNAGGGCSLVSRQWLEARIAEAFRQGAVSARAEAEKAAQICRRELGT